MTGVEPYVFTVTDRLRRVIEVARGPEDAAAWLAELPGVVRDYTARWGLTPTGLPDSGAMSCCVFARAADGRDVVLKIPFDQPAGELESAVLARWARRGGAPRVYQVDPATGVFTMARIRPGAIAEPAGGAEASRAIVSLMGRLHQADAANLPAVPPLAAVVQMRLDWADERFDITGNEAGAALARAARALADELLAAGEPLALLHGDLQPKNILLSHAEGIQVIDPLPCLGPAVSDAALWAVVQASPTPVEDRVAELASLGGFDADSLQAWATVFAIAELRPYSPRYSGRMAAYLGSGRVSPRLAAGARRRAPQLARAAMQVTASI
ncbi:MAG: aminoglycoside phosphotransferase family protein [Bifidobacteriaceae bacterium]|nr:aminoglycoside phosphotransferase family protein [Bifidobacteriaceae bacterium]